MMFGPGWSGMGWGMLLLWAVLIVAVVALVRWLTATAASTPAEPPSGVPGPSALDILAQRYARGEIEREEFEQKRRDLERL